MIEFYNYYAIIQSKYDKKYTKEKKMNKKRLLIIGVLLVTTATLFAKDEDSASVPAYIEFNNSLGFQAGEISGTGLSYQNWVTDRVSLMTSFGVYYNPYVENMNTSDSVLNYSLGEELQYRVYGDDYSDWFSAQLYTFVGLNHSGNIPVVKQTDGYYDDGNWVDAVYAAGSYSPNFSLGLGIGIELILLRHISIPLELGYSATWKPLAETFAKQFSADLIPQIGFKYRY